MSTPIVKTICVELTRQEVAFLLCVLLTAPDRQADDLIALFSDAYHGSRIAVFEIEPEEIDFSRRAGFRREDHEFDLCAQGASGPRIG